MTGIPSTSGCKLARRKLFKPSRVEGGYGTFSTIHLFNYNILLSLHCQTSLHPSLLYGQQQQAKHHIFMRAVISSHGNSISGYRRGERLGEKACSRDPNIKSAGYGRFNRNHPYLFFLPAADLEDRRRKTVPLFSTRLSSSLLVQSSPSPALGLARLGSK
jgi:hypothetical protein